MSLLPLPQTLHRIFPRPNSVRSTCFPDRRIIFTGQNFAHHQPRDRPETDGETDDEEHETGQRQPAVLGHVVAVVLVVEERAEGDQRDSHCRAGSVQQYFPAEFVDETGRYERGQEIDDTDDYGAQVFVDGAPGFLRSKNGKPNKIKSVTTVKRQTDGVQR